MRLTIPTNQCNANINVMHIIWILCAPINTPHIHIFSDDWCWYVVSMITIEITCWVGIYHIEKIELHWVLLNWVHPKYYKAITIYIESELTLNIQDYCITDNTAVITNEVQLNYNKRKQTCLVQEIITGHRNRYIS